MTRFRKALTLVGLSSYLLAAGACEMTGDGWSFFPSVQDQLNALLAGFTT